MKAAGSQSLDLQRDALQAEGVDAVNVYHDFTSGVPRRPPGTRQVLSKAIDNWALGVESGLIFRGVAALAVATSGDRTIYAG